MNRSREGRGTREVSLRIIHGSYRRENGGEEWALTGVVDLDSVNPDPNTDPDPAFQVNPDPDTDPWF